MPHQEIPSKLSEQAHAEFKTIVRKEYPDQTFTNEEIYEMGTRPLRVFDLLSQPAPAKEAQPIMLSEQEKKSMNYMHTAIYHRNENPSVRSLTRALGSLEEI